jgi:hypothetical protein
MVKGKRVGKAGAKSIRGAKTLKLRIKGKAPKRVKLVASAADASGNRATARRSARVR